MNGPLAGQTINGSLDYFGTVRARLGYAFDKFLPYITGGAAWGHVDYGNIYGVGTSSTNWGWTIGAGFEYAVTNNITAGLEYLYVIWVQQLPVPEPDLAGHLVQHERPARSRELQVLIRTFPVTRTPGESPGFFIAPTLPHLVLASPKARRRFPGCRKVLQPPSADMQQCC